ncbi:MAG: prepilin-type N-terminal cleavage/methylation domain-containing protein [Gammaproteobacteria bacterium]|nr:prepilin-type N-terminal cleavage/methylation domain-containing protein [Gammaproteobacteria bacterium]MDH5652915.1 prepilin-type N-terminal cleavage/methylation domain-containing protein [Gammaproteobacteria bacterium]
MIAAQNISQQGFTLVEMMVALLLLSMITIIGYQGIGFDVQQWHKGEEKTARAMERYQAGSMLRTKLSALERLGYEKNGQNLLAFQGLSDSIKFISRFENTRQGGLYTCLVSAHKQHKRIELRYGLYHPENGGFDAPHNTRMTEIMSGVSMLRFWYFGSRDSGQERWYDDWQASNSLPKLIKYRYTLTDGSVGESIIYVETAGV